MNFTRKEKKSKLYRVILIDTAQIKYKLKIQIENTIKIIRVMWGDRLRKNRTAVFSLRSLREIN